jgi:hypothetical protein
MLNQDQVLERRVRDIVAVAVPDIDAVLVEVEDGVAYVEGVVPSEHHRHLILSAVEQVKGLRRLITCLVTEHVVSPVPASNAITLCSAPVLMHYYSLS